VYRYFDELALLIINTVSTATKRSRHFSRNKLAVILPLEMFTRNTFICKDDKKIAGKKDIDALCKPLPIALVKSAT
jgi:hypothetical protein